MKYEVVLGIQFEYLTVLIRLESAIEMGDHFSKLSPDPV
jgi:hypothetical protein